MMTTKLGIVFGELQISWIETSFLMAVEIKQCLKAKLAVIGTGVMGEAMIRGLIAQGSVEPHQITGTNALLDRNEEMQIKHHIHVTDDNAAAVESADIVIISVKPRCCHGSHR